VEPPLLVLGDQGQGAEKIAAKITFPGQSGAAWRRQTNQGICQETDQSDDLLISHVGAGFKPAPTRQTWYYLS
jgi:hypothetical protein